MTQILCPPDTTVYPLTDELWTRISTHLPAPRRKLKTGRPRMNDRQAMNAIWYKLHSGCSWKSLPAELGAGSTIYDRFQEWQAAGVFDKLRQAGVLQIDQEGLPV